MDRPLLFGKYCLLERTSVGGMAEVFRAKPLDAPDPDRYFALKRILPHLAEDNEFIKMFVDEARLTVQLRHPNIVHIYELGQFQSSHYIVMEYIAGKDLLAFQKLVRRQESILDVDMACHIMLEIAKGLDYAHRKADEQGNPLGIIHRDISPQNVLVSWDGRVRVIDFGIAKAASQSTKTKAGVLKGKFGYLSPEQVRAEPIDRRSDIFAMGTLFWELLTNQRLFNASNQYETLTMIGEPNVEPPSATNPAIPPEVDAIAMKALEADPDSRFQWGSDFASALQGYLSSQKPPYHRSQLTTWLRSAFEEEFEEEKAKRDRFREINSADDVRRLFDAQYGEGGDDGDQESEDATQIWDVDEAPDSDVDLESFVANHTVVQAGGLELSDYDEWDDAPDTIDEEQEVVQSRINEVITGESLQRVKIDEESRYDVPATVISDPASADSSPPPPNPAQALSVQQRASSNQDETGPTTPPAPAQTTMTSAATPPQGAQREAARRASTKPVTGPQAVVEAASLLSSLDQKKILAIAAAVVAIIALSSAVVFVAVGDDEEVVEEEVPVRVGGVQFEVSPPSELGIYFDGEWRGDQAPLTLRDLEPGTYPVEIDHPRLPPWRGEIDVEVDEIATVDVDLEGDGQLSLSWENNPEELELYLDGEPIEYEEGAEEVELDLVRGSYIIDAYGDGIRPIRREVFVESGAVNDVELRWVASDQLTLTGDEELEVIFDGRSLGELPLTLSGLELNRLYELEVGDLETVLGYPERGREEIDSSEFEQLMTRSEDDFGWLTLDFDEDRRWQLVIDDVEIGLLVPLDDNVEIPVAAGDRTIGFQRNDIRHEFEVTVYADETVLFRPILPDDN